MRLRPLLLAVALYVLLAPSAGAAEYVPGEVIVRSGEPSAPVTRVVKVRDVEAAIARLRRRPDVISATPNYVARMSLVPNDPGRSTKPGGWQGLQWNFAGRFGVNAPAAWDNLALAGRPGGSDVIVAVLDTGVAYADSEQYARSPDLRPDGFVPGYDFIGNDPFPHDNNGHGTHVASTIAEAVDNGVGATGLAFGAKLMPVRVLDGRGEGDSAAIAEGIRFAADNGASVINLSFQFGRHVEARDIPDILDALRYADRRGVLVVAAAGNAQRRAIHYPARAPGVLAVGATTERGCRARYSNYGPGLQIVAPGGGRDATIEGDRNCHPERPRGRDIVQMTFLPSNLQAFGLPDGYRGTSMAAPHVSATAALVIASGVLGERPTPEAISIRLRATARDLGKPGRDVYYGAGLVDAAAATARP